MIPHEQVFQIAKSHLTAHQKVLLLVLISAQKPLSTKELCLAIGTGYPANRAAVVRQVKYMIDRKLIAREFVRRKIGDGSGARDTAFYCVART